MDLPHTGSRELIVIQTDKISLTIKGCASHPSFDGIEVQSGEATLDIYCKDSFDLSVLGYETSNHYSKFNHTIGCEEKYHIKPIFFEQQIYDVFIEPEKNNHFSFWHENFNVRNKITPVGKHGCLSGSINFGNEIGLSNLVIQLDGENYLKLTIEIFPTKINYQEDYKAIITDVTDEVYNIVFDFLKKTYLGYQQSEHFGNSSVEYFSIINTIFNSFLKSIDMIFVQPHHMLEKTYDIVPAHKARHVDRRGLRWLEKHPGQMAKSENCIKVSKVLATKKQVTYNTNENKLVKNILQTTIRRLEQFERQYERLGRETDQLIIEKIDGMINQLKRRYNYSFLSDVQTQSTSVEMSLVFSMAPGYREFYKYYLMLLRGLDITGDIFNISVKDLSVLYEYWCFIKLNSLMKKRYELVSQDIIKTNGNGLFVSMVKGIGSKVVYRNPQNMEKIILTYNPSIRKLPTVSQRPDNVLSLMKTGTDIQYEYVFDAKYRINPALPGTYYYNNISTIPGPQEDDINTMHRYRDAIVYQHNNSKYERKMFGAYVLFPYNNRAIYEKHRFYQSIAKVNVGGLPFLPSETSMVTEFLDELITDSSQSAYERTTLPIGLERKLAKVDWSKRDVLIGVLKNSKQLDINLKYRFYHIPASK